MYDLVLEGRWTWDQFFSLSQLVSLDLDGDGIITSADQVGWCGGSSERLAAIPFSCDIHITERTENGLELVYWSDKVVDIFEKTLMFFSDTNYVNQYWQDTSKFEDGRFQKLFYMFSALIVSGNNNIASKWKATEKGAKKSIEVFVEAMNSPGR